MRLVELGKGELQLVKKEVDHCIDEVNLLCFLLRDELANTGVIVTGVDVYSGENAHRQSGCKDCGKFIFSSEIFDSVEEFNKKFWESFLTEQKSEDLLKNLANDVTEDNVFQEVASKIIGYLSQLQFVTLQKAVLPVTKKDATDNIKQSLLLLNCYQMDIAYSNDKRIWLEGNYGTGKTVVALKKLELLFKALKDKEVIYYINFARKSLPDLMIKQKFEKDNNVKAIRAEYSLSNTIKLQILPKEREQGTKNINLIVDEYSSQDLSSREVESLIPILNEEEEFINARVLIAVQPIKINRVDNFCERGITRRFSQLKHEPDKLITATGIKIRILEKLMRRTVQINKLEEFTREYLNNQSNRCVRLQQSYKNRSSLEEVTDLDLDKKKLNEPSFNSSFQHTSLESNFSLSVMPEDFFQSCYHHSTISTGKVN